MGVFAGCGGNGASQLGRVRRRHPGRRAVRQHLAAQLVAGGLLLSDPVTGLPGFTTDDQLKDLEGRPLWYTDTPTPT